MQINSAALQLHYILYYYGDRVRAKQTLSSTNFRLICDERKQEKATSKISNRGAMKIDAHFMFMAHEAI